LIQALAAVKLRFASLPHFDLRIQNSLMDSQHRHELGENELAHWLTGKIEKVKPYLHLILFGFAAALVGSFAYSSWSGSTSEIEELAWQQYSVAVNLRSGGQMMYALEQVAEDHPDTSVVPWANITWADGHLATAAGQYLGNRAAANTALEKAEEKYKAIIADRSVVKRLRDRAHFGLGRVYELRGELEAAIKEYEQVEGAFGDLAKLRAEELADPTVEEDYAWLVTAESPAGMSGMPSSFGGSLDATPDPLELPGEEPSADESLSDLLRNLSGAQLPIASEEGREEGSEEGSEETEGPDEGETETGAAEPSGAESGGAAPEAMEPEATDSDSTDSEAMASEDSEPAGEESVDADPAEATDGEPARGETADGEPEDPESGDAESGDEEPMDETPADDAAPDSGPADPADEAPAE